MGLSGNLARSIKWFDRRMVVGLLVGLFSFLVIRGDFERWHWTAMAMSAGIALLLAQRLLLVYRVRSRFSRKTHDDPYASWEYLQLELLLLLAVYSLLQLSGTIESPLYPLLYALLAAVGGLDERRRNVVVVSLVAGAMEALPILALVHGAGDAQAWALSPVQKYSILAHLAAIAFFPHLSRVMIATLRTHLRQLARRAAREHETRFKEENQRIEQVARQYRLDAGVADLNSGDRSEQKRKRSSVDSLKQRVGSLLVILREALRPNTVAFFLIARDGKSITLMDSLSETPDKLISEPIPAGQGVIGAILKNVDTVSFNHLREDPERFNYYSSKVGLKTFMGVPLLDQVNGEQQVKGVLLVDRKADLGFGPDEEQLLKTAGQELLYSIHTERVIGVTEKLGGLLEASNQLNRAVNLPEVVDEVLQQVCDLLTGAELAVIALNDKSSSYLAGIKTVDDLNPWREKNLGQEIEDDCLCSQSIDSCTVLPARQFHERSRDQRQVFGPSISLDGIESLKCFPLKVASPGGLKSKPGEEQAIGALVIGSRERNVFPEDQEELNRTIGLLEIISNMGAISIQNAQRWEQLERLATTDGLTGLHNHRRFKEMLDEAVESALRYDRPLSVILTDIDHFKNVNDTYGHPMGDEVLKRVSRVLSEIARSADKVCRYGGEEFTIILPETDQAGARMLAERFREAIKAQRFTFEGTEFSITLSLGICTLPDFARHRQELIDRADQSLYHAKNNGRDRTVHIAEIADAAASGG